MKRLSIMVATVTLAVAAHAGCFIWGFGSAADLKPGATGDEDFLEGGTAMLFLGTVTETSATGGYTLDFSKATQIATAGQAPDPSFTFGSLAFDANVKSDLVTPDVSQAYSLILFSESGVTDFANYTGSYALVTGNSTYAEDPATSTPYAKMTSADAITSWNTAVVGSSSGGDVPEPMSGLLLVVGGALLALRRKHA